MGRRAPVCGGNSQKFLPPSLLMFQSKPGKRKCQLSCQKNAFYSCTGVVLQILRLGLCVMVWVWGLFYWSIMRWFSNKQRRVTFNEKRMMSWSEPDVSLLAPSLMRLAMTLTCVTHSNWFVCTSFKWMLLNVWMVKMSLLCPDCCWESGRWQSSGRNIYHHLATTSNSKRIRPISQKHVLPCLTISRQAYLFLRLGNSITFCNHRHRRQSTLWFRVLLACLGWAWAWWHVVDQDCLDWFCLFYVLFSLFVLHLLEWLDIHV